MIEKVIKRDGRIEDFCPDKMNRWAKWSIKEINNGLVDWSEIVIEVMKQLDKIVTSGDLQEKLINVCLEKETWSYSLVAGKLYATLMQKDVHGDRIPTLKEKHEQMVEQGMMIDLGYSDDEYARLERVINHDVDLTYPHYTLIIMREKYALKNVITNQEYETPQFSIMRVAMDVGRYARPYVDDVVEFVTDFYNAISKRKINIPTPYWVNCGTSLRGFASCCVFESGDSAESLDVGKLIAGKMTQSSAGIGGHIVTRSINDGVRGGKLAHLGKLPCYNAVAHVMKEFTQQGRGGAATMYFSAFDPEIKDLQALKNPMTPLNKQNRMMDYSIIYNDYFVNAVKNDEMIALYSYQQAPHLYWSQFSKDENAYLRELTKLKDAGIEPKEYIRAQEVLANTLTEAFETGRSYEFNATNSNKHTPFKDPIKSSNLCCVTGDTNLTVKVNGNIKTISMNELMNIDGDVEVLSYNTETNEKEFKKIKAKALTRKNASLIKITDVSTGKSLRCTPDHLVYTKNRGYIQAQFLNSDDIFVVE